ncbi:TraM recognition domain-containing protein, partial [Nocardia puris]
VSTQQAERIIDQTQRHIRPIFGKCYGYPGVRCWGEDGMKALWSAANVKVIGGGLDDEAFLRARSELIGPHYEQSVSVSKAQGGHRSHSVSRTTEITLHPSDLAAMPRGRCVVFTSGNRATLAQTVP